MSDMLRKSLAISKEWIPVLGGIAGLAALYGFVNSFVLLPSRVDAAEKKSIEQAASISHMEQDAKHLSQRVFATEEVNKAQSVEMAEIQKDAIQRREMLAVALAMITEINDRTKRTEQIIMSWKK